MIGASYITPEGVNLYPVIAPALIIVGCMMMSCVKKIDWENYAEATPAFLTITVMPFCGFSISKGISFGFISYSLLKLISRRGKDVHWIIYTFSLLFILRYIFLVSK